MTTVAQALASARALGLDRLDAQLLLSHHLDRPRPWLLAHADAILPAELARRIEDDMKRRAAGLPLAYVLGQWRFRGLKLKVDPSVLVPRPETEVLVDWALELLRSARSASDSPRLLDLGTGSGAIALAMAEACPHARIVAIDASAAALEVAQANGRSLDLSVEWLRGHWWQPVAGRVFDLVVSNPPYIAEGDAHLNALSHEPPGALTSGPHGLDALHEIIAGAPAHVAPGGWLLLEHGHDQGEAVQRMLLSQGFESISTRQDLADLPRCSGGRRP